MNRLLLPLLGVVAGFLLALAVMRTGLLDSAGVGGGAAHEPASARRVDVDDEARAADADNNNNNDDEDDDDIPSRVVDTSGGRFVRLDQAEQALAGIRVARLPLTTVTPEIHAVGIVADDPALAAAHAELARARERRAAQAATAAAVGERLARLRALADGGRLGAAREIADLEVTARRERERTLELGAAVAQAEQALVARWGRELVEVSAPGTPLAATLAAGEAALVSFALPNNEAPAGTQHVGVDGARESAVPARLLAPAPSVLASASGASWYAVATLSGVRHGMAVDVWAPSVREPLRGALLPDAAVVWHGGRRWYFAARDEGLFERIALPAQPGGLAQALLPAATTDVAIVTRGAQTLLAEEFRGAIPDEDDD
ncbi:MAG: hypothetical protein RLW42_20065 [Gammaproteobacteria bacterium]